MNIVAYIHRHYIPRLLYRLTDKYNVYLSVITDERSYVSYSVHVSNTSSIPKYLLYLTF
jgi:hypothetical protein